MPSTTFVRWRGRGCRDRCWAAPGGGERLGNERSSPPLQGSPEPADSLMAARRRLLARTRCLCRRHRGLRRFNGFLVVVARIVALVACRCGRRYGCWCLVAVVGATQATG